MVLEIQATYITASVSLLVGVIAAVTALWVNLSNKKDEIQTVNKAMLAEISRLLFVLCSHLNWWQGCMKSGNTDLPLIPFSTDVYDNFLKNIGDLDASYASKAVGFYGFVKFINSLQKTRESHLALGKEKIFMLTYEAALNSLAKDYRDKFDHAFRQFDVEPPYMAGCQTIIDNQAERLKHLGIVF